MQKFTLGIVLLQTAIIALLLTLYFGQSPRPDAPQLTSAANETTESAGPAEVRASERRDEVEVESALRKSAAPEANVLSTGLEGTLLVGRITASDGQALVSPSLTVRPKGQTGPFISGSINAGTYAIPSLQPGVYEVSCRATGVIPLQTEIEIGTAATQVYDIEVRRARLIRVKVLDENGKPLPDRNISVVASEGELPDAFPLTNRSSAEDMGVGRFEGSWHHRELPAGYIGILQVESRAPLWIGLLLRQHVVARTQLAPEASEVEFRIAASALAAVLARATVRVVAQETGLPIEGARVSFSDRQSGGGGKLTDANGHVEIEGIVPGLLELVVAAKDRERYHSNHRITAGSKFDVGTIRLGAARKIEGRVVDMQGSPVGGVHFVWVRRERYADTVPWDSGVSAVSKSDGTFSLWGCGPGTYFVRATTGELVCETTIDTTSGDVSDAVIQLSAASQVSVTSDVPRGKIYLVRILRQGAPIHSWLARPFTRSLERKIHLVPGRYEVQLFDDDRLVRTLPLDARARGAKFVIP